MARMVTDARQLLDQSRHPRERPQLGPIPLDDRTFQKGFHDLLGWGRVELWLGTRPSLAGQGGHSPLLPGVPPSVADLSGHPQPTGHLRSAQTSVEQPGRLLPPPFQLRLITSACPARSMAAPQTIVTLIREFQ